jgi:CRP-like cAMP-binding protein
MSPPSPGAIAAMRQLTDGHGLLHLQPGDVIFRAGDPGDTLFGIVEGAVKLFWGEGERYEMLGPGSTFGVGALVDPRHRRHGTAIAVKETMLLAMNRMQFLFAMQELPMFALEMLHDLEERLWRLKTRGVGRDEHLPVGNAEALRRTGQPQPPAESPKRADPSP